MPRPATANNLDTLADSQRLTLALLALASRPLEDDDPETVIVRRRDLARLLHESGLELGPHRVNALLEEILDHANAPAVRALRHAGIVRVALTRPTAHPLAEESWRALLAAQRLRPLGVTLRYDLERAGFDTTAPLPADVVRRAVVAPTARAARCTACGAVRTADEFGTERGRLRGVCSRCTA